jgi:ABC-type multidrug transport system ATPase subunit
MQPDLLLLDEPLASLDPASAREALEIFRSLADGGMSVLLVEHRVEDALLIEPERVMYMAEGKIRYLGAADGLRDQVDYRQVKLPAEIIIEQAARQPEPAPFKPAIHQGKGPSSRSSPSARSHSPTMRTSPSCAGSTSTSTQARSSPCSGLTAPARRHWSSTPLACSNQPKAVSLCAARTLAS